MCSYTKGITATSILRDFDEISTILCTIDHKIKNIDHLSKMVDYQPMVDNIDPVAALQNAYKQWQYDKCHVLAIHDIVRYEILLHT